MERVADGWELDEVVRETGALKIEGAPSESEPWRTKGAILFLLNSAVFLALP